MEIVGLTTAVIGMVTSIVGLITSIVTMLNVLDSNSQKEKNRIPSQQENDSKTNN